MKKTFKNILVSVVALMVFTTAFSGCGKNNDEQAEATIVGTDSSYSETAETTTEAIVTTAPNPSKDFASNLYSLKGENLPKGIPSSIVSFYANNGSKDSYLFKNWYDNIDTTVINNGIELTTSESDWKDLYTVYSNDNNRHYIMSGKKPVFLTDDTITPEDRKNLRFEDGTKVYFRDYNEIRNQYSSSRISHKIIACDAPDKSILYSDFVNEFANNLKACGETQPQNLEERNNLNNGKSICGEFPEVYVNNIKITCITYPSYTYLIPYNVVSELFPELMSYGKNSNFNTITLHTANGDQTYVIDFVGSTYMAIVRPDGSRLMIDNFEVMGDDVYLPADILEYTFGWQIEVYEDFVNIVTDQKDLVDADKSNLILESSLVDIPDEVGSKYGELLEYETQYTLNEILPYITAEDYESLTTKVPENPKASQEAIDGLQAWKDAPKYFISDEFGYLSNPSLIPYDEITVDNIDQAFPSLYNSIGELPYVPFTRSWELYGPNTSRQDMFDSVMSANLRGSGYNPMNKMTVLEEKQYQEKSDAYAEKLNKIVSELEDVM